MVVKYFDIETWHKRLSHIGEKGLKILARKGFLPSFVSLSLKACVHYLPRKTYRIIFESFSLSKKSYILDLIHTNVSIMLSRSIRGALYFVTFVDSCFRKLCAFALTSKH